MGNIIFTAICLIAIVAAVAIYVGFYKKGNTTAMTVCFVITALIAAGIVGARFIPDSVKTMEVAYSDDVKITLVNSSNGNAEVVKYSSVIHSDGGYAKGTQVDVVTDWTGKIIYIGPAGSAGTFEEPTSGNDE